MMMLRCCLRRTATPRPSLAREDELQSQLEVLRNKNAQLELDLERKTSQSRSRKMTIGRLTDELSAARQIAAETQLRQLEELQTLSKENRELKQVLLTLIGQQQQPTVDEHHHGILASNSYLPSILSCQLENAYYQVVTTKQELAMFAVFALPDIVLMKYRHS